MATYVVKRDMLKHYRRGWRYINRGLGYLRRVRFNARPEITVFRLEAG